jgi:hypothetical protein
MTNPQSQYKYKNDDAVLTNPGIFAFQLDDKQIKIGKAKYIFNEGIAKQIQRIITQCFLRISSDLQSLIPQNPEYLSQIDTKLQKFILNNKFRFPGLQVINITKQLLKFFSYMPDRFLICEKSDGVRYILLHFANGLSLFVGRNLEFYMVNINEKLYNTYTNNQNDWELIHFLDGELILDNSDKLHSNKQNEVVFEDNNIKQVKYLVYDAIVINKENIGARSFCKRLEHLQYLFNIIECNRHAKLMSYTFCKKYKQQIQMSEFITCNKLETDYNDHLMYNQSNRNLNYPFAIDIYMKDYFTLEQVSTVYSITKSLAHHSDGIIINTDDYPYYSGQATEIFKWKPNELQTIDFAVVYNESLRLYEMKVKDGGSHPTVACLFFKKESNDYQMFMDGYNTNADVIAECYFDRTFNDDDVVVFNYNLYTKQHYRDGVNIAQILYHYDSAPVIDDDVRKQVQFGGWRFMRFRTDKKEPNSITTYDNIIKCFEEDIKFEDLVNEVKCNRGKVLKEMIEVNNCVSAAVWKTFYSGYAQFGGGMGMKENVKKVYNDSGSGNGSGSGNKYVDNINSGENNLGVKRKRNDENEDNVRSSNSGGDSGNNNSNSNKDGYDSFDDDVYDDDDDL